MKLALIAISLFASNLFANEDKELRLKNIFKSSTLTQVECKNENLEIISYKHTTFEKFATFTWSAKCGLDSYSCSGTENGPICMKNVSLSKK